MCAKEKWTLGALSDKLDWEGEEYIVREIDPEDVEDEEVAELLRVIQPAYWRMFDLILGEE